MPHLLPEEVTNEEIIRKSPITASANAHEVKNESDISTSTKSNSEMAALQSMLSLPNSPDKTTTSPIKRVVTSTFRTDCNKEIESIRQSQSDEAATGGLLSLATSCNSNQKNSNEFENKSSNSSETENPTNSDSSHPLLHRGITNSPTSEAPKEVVVSIENGGNDSKMVTPTPMDANNPRKGFSHPTSFDEERNRVLVRKPQQEHLYSREHTTNSSYEHQHQAGQPTSEEQHHFAQHISYNNRISGRPNLYVHTERLDEKEWRRDELDGEERGVGNDVTPTASTPSSYCNHSLPMHEKEIENAVRMRSPSFRGAESPYVGKRERPTSSSDVPARYGSPVESRAYSHYDPHYSSPYFSSSHRAHHHYYSPPHSRQSHSKKGSYPPPPPPHHYPPHHPHHHYSGHPYPAYYYHHPHPYHSRPPSSSSSSMDPYFYLHHPHHPYASHYRHHPPYHPHPLPPHSSSANSSPSASQRQMHLHPGHDVVEFAHHSEPNATTTPPRARSSHELEPETSSTPSPCKKRRMISPIIVSSSSNTAPPPPTVNEENHEQDPPPAAEEISSKIENPEINSVSHWQQVQIRNGGFAPSANRCVPLKAPVPSKFWGDVEKMKDAYVPDFHRLVNFPDYLPKNRPPPGDGRRCCVMCGKQRLCTASLSKNNLSPAKPLRSADNSKPSTTHIIPRQNKGLCTSCDVTVWVVTSSGLEIKWCKGCKNFRPWAAFGDKGLATKCVRCRDRQREKYAMQKDSQKRKSLTEAKPAPKAPDPRSQLHPSNEDDSKKIEIDAARGLSNLLNAAVKSDTTVEV